MKNMKKLYGIFLTLFLIMIFNINVYAKIVNFNKDVKLVNIILFDDFKFEELKDDFLKKSGIDIDYVSIFNDKHEEITESNYRRLVSNFENLLIYEYRDIFGKKIIKDRMVYIFSKDEFAKSVSIDSKFIKNVSVDIIYNDNSASKILVGKIFADPKLDENKDCYIIKISRNNKILWGKMFENLKVSKFNKITDIFNNEFCLTGFAYRNSGYIDGFIVKFDGDGNFIEEGFDSLSNID